MNKLMALAIALTAGGCALRGAPGESLKPVAEIAGPVFAEGRFDCKQRPLPPDPATAGAKAGSAASEYEGQLRYWGQACSNQLQSVGNELRGAGQVVGD